MTPKFKINDYVLFATFGGRRVGRVLGIYEPANDNTWKYCIESVVLVPGSDDRLKKVDSYYNFSEDDLSLFS